MRARNAAWEDCHQSNTPETWEVYRTLRNKGTKLIMKEKWEYQPQLRSKLQRHPKFLYHVAKSRAKIKPGIAALITAGEVTATTEEATARF